ncbi:MAG: HDOD domain-containing protein [Deltaproteobacteria bacterium]|nr:HDOD domain-containing protein [Deltaproteobacteria bacterium]
MKCCILFVDDEPNVIAGLRRMLHPLRAEWDMHFATSGAEALTLAEKLPLDVVVSDMRMPGMDGATLLGEIRDRYPSAIRIVLSGHSDRAMAMGSVRVAHQYLAKPCSADKLRTTIDRARQLRATLQSPHLAELISRMDRLPSIPALYTQLVDEIESPSGSAKRAGEIIARDVAMSAKVLQFVNSAFFGMPQRVTSPAQAAVLLGLNLLKSLVLGFQVFSVDRNAGSAADLERLWAHSLTVSSLARHIASEERAPPQEVEDAVIGGMLHDIGKILVPPSPSSPGKPDLAEDDERFVREYGVSIEQLGAYLLGIWGLPASIVEIVAYHRRPSERAGPRSLSIWSVHAANAVAERFPEDDPDVLGIDREYAGPGDLVARVRSWNAACLRLR